MLKNLELTLFVLSCALYLVAWGWHLRGWKLGSAAQNRIAIRILGGLASTSIDGRVALVPGRARANAQCV